MFPPKGRECGIANQLLSTIQKAVGVSQVLNVWLWRAVWQCANLLARVLLGLVYAFTSVQTHLLVEEYSPMHCKFCRYMVFIQDFQL